MLQKCDELELCDAKESRVRALKAPFPWFGGKSRVAQQVWAALGDVDMYVEPFAGSLAVLLNRPHAPRNEIVNDLDCYIANFWRALQHDPRGVARYANNPANEADLHARHIWLVNTGRERVERLLGDPNYYDAQVAGWWVWGLSNWIGGEWCDGRGGWTSENGRLVRRDKSGSTRAGVTRRKIYVMNDRGVNRKSIYSTVLPAGVRTGEVELTTYMESLAERLRFVVVMCGDWSRVVTAGALSKGRTVGVFLDPPYGIDMRDKDVYITDRENGNVSTAVREWCIANQDNPRYRIVLAGYEGEHDLPGWRVVRWTGTRAYGTSRGESPNSVNRFKERLWLSPHCLELPLLEDNLCCTHTRG